MKWGNHQIDVAARRHLFRSIHLKKILKIFWAWIRAAEQPIDLKIHPTHMAKNDSSSSPAVFLFLCARGRTTWFANLTNLISATPLLHSPTAAHSSPTHDTRPTVLPLSVKKIFFYGWSWNTLPSWALYVSCLRSNKNGGWVIIFIHSI